MRRVLLYVPSHREIPEARESWLRQKASNTWVDVFIMRYDPFPDEGAYPNLRVKNKIAKAMFIAGQYDYFFHVEDDVILPADALELLMAAHVPIIAGIGRLRPENSGDCHITVRIKDPDKRSSSDDRPLELLDINEERRIIECTGIWYGCTLIDSEFLNLLGDDVGEDWKFTRVANEHGLQLYAHTGVRCGHVDKDGNVWRIEDYGPVPINCSYDLSAE